MVVLLALIIILGLCPGLVTNGIYEFARRYFMKLYDQIFNVVKDFRKFFSPGPVTNADVSGSITSEILLIVSLVLTCLLLRHVSYIAFRACYLDCSCCFK